MNSIFGSKSRARTSASSTATSSHNPSSPVDLAGSVPYNQIPSSHPPPIAGPSTSTLSFGSRKDAGISVTDIGAPTSNPSLGSEGTMFNLHNRRSESSSLVPSPHPTIARANSKASMMSASTRRPSGEDGRYHVHAEPGGLLQQVDPLSPEINRYPNLSIQTSRSPGYDHGARSPFAVSVSPRDNDTMSIRTVSSVGSTTRRDMGPNRERDRYPSFTKDPVVPVVTGRQVSFPSEPRPPTAYSTPPPDPRPMSRTSSRTSQQTNTPRAPPSSYTPSVMSLSSNAAGRRVSDDLSFSRPPDAEVERLFQRLLETRNVDDSAARMPALSSRSSVSSQINIAKTAATLPVDIKWQMVESDARARHEASKAIQKKEEEPAKAGKAAKRGTAGAVVKNSPQWFLKMVLDGSLTTQHISTLAISLRTQPLDWLEEFMACQGQVALANYLLGVTTKRARGNVDVDMEMELLKCLKKSLSSRIGAADALSKPAITAAVCNSLISPHLPCRKLAAEILTFFCHYDEAETPRRGLPLVVGAFDALEQRLNANVTDVANKAGRFDAWINQLEQAIVGRGRMGSMVGISKELKGNDDHSIIEYCITSIYLVLGLTSSNDLRARCGVRAQLETAGLLGVFRRLRPWNDELVGRMIKQYEEEAESDRRELAEEQDQLMLRSMRNPQDVFAALLQQTQGSKASAYLLDAMRHMLLIKDEGDQKVRYFQLIDRLISSIVMSDTPDLTQDFSRAFGVSVSHLVNRFVEQERLDVYATQIQDLKSSLAQVTREKMELSEEMNSDDLVSSLKAQVAELEERLRKSRAATEAVTDQKEGMRRDYEARISDLEMIIQELFNMLREANHLEEVQGLNDGPINRKQLIFDLREQWERKKTISQLEGRHSDKNRRKTLLAGGADNDGEEDDESEGEQSAGAETAASGPPPPAKAGSSVRAKKMSQSQFMDAPDERVRAHIETALSKEADHISPLRSGPAQSLRSTRRPDAPRRGNPSGPPIGAKSSQRASVKKSGPPPRFLEELRYAQLSRSVSESAIALLEDDAPDEITAEYRQSVLEGLLADPSAAEPLTPGPSRRESALRQSMPGRAGAPGEELSEPRSLDTLVEGDERTPEKPSAPGPSAADFPAPPAPPPPPPLPTSTFPAPPPPPPPPPLPGAPGAVAAAAPPPPPPPPPPGGSIRSGIPAGPQGAMAGLLAGIKGGVKLKSVGQSGADDESSSNEPSKPRAPFAPAAPRAPLAPLSSLLHGANDSRKDVSLMASRKMKQLQWEKVSKAQLGKTVWSAPEVAPVEDELAAKMKAVNLWSEMEDEFKAKEIIYDAVKKRKETELLSVLAADHRKRIEILMAGSTAKSFKDPERLSEAIANFNADLCTETFLRELQGVLPSDEDRGKLLTHSTDTEAQLDLLHPADRLMVKLIQLPHLSDRVNGMLFQVSFAQNLDLLQKSLELLTIACTDLRNATQFKELLNIILMMGNYMNGTNFAGGAFGFKIASINRLVDTKSSNGQNLLHFVERVVTQHFPEVQGFLDELAKPSEANRVSFQDMQSTSKKMLDDIRGIRKSLQNNFTHVNDGYARKMFRFSAVAEEEMQEVRDGILQAEKHLRDVQTYYGEGEEMGRPLQSQDFFGIFRTFTSSWKFCRAQNRARAEEQAVREKRAQARAALTPQTTGASENNLIDARMQRLRLEGTPRVRREKRRAAPPLSPLPASADYTEFMLPQGGDGTDVDYGTLAQKMMNDIFSVSSPTASETQTSTASAPGSGAGSGSGSGSGSAAAEPLANGHAHGASQTSQDLEGITSEALSPRSLADPSDMSPGSPTPSSGLANVLGKDAGRAPPKLGYTGSRMSSYDFASPLELGAISEMMEFAENGDADEEVLHVGGSPETPSHSPVSTREKGKGRAEGAIEGADSMADAVEDA